MAEDPVQVVLREIDKEMDKYIDRVFFLSQQNLITDNKVDTGTLLKTANVNRRFLEKEIVYPADYADTIENGAGVAVGGKPFRPPASSLVKWVRRKLGIQNEAEAKRVAFVISRSIEKRGIMPSPYLEPAFRQANAEAGIKVIE